jgi:hypothetical protein
MVQSNRIAVSYADDSKVIAWDGKVIAATITMSVVSQDAI